MSAEEEQDALVRKHLKRCHAMGLPVVCEATGLTEAQAAASLRRLMVRGKAFKKARLTRRVVYSAYRSR